MREVCDQFCAQTIQFAQYLNFSSFFDAPDFAAYPDVKLPSLEIDYPTRSVEVAGQEVRLTPKEFELLFALASAPGRVFSREELMEKVWGRPSEGDMRTVDTHVKRLRHKLEERFAVPWSVATVWGVGYKLELRG